jgi:hypothetical protein
MRNTQNQRGKVRAYLCRQVHNTPSPNAPKGFEQENRTVSLCLRALRLDLELGGHILCYYVNKWRHPKVRDENSKAGALP